MNNVVEMYHEELEDITGKIYEGDITTLVFDLLAKSNHLDSLYKELKGEEFVKEAEYVQVVPEASPKFTEWFEKFSEIT